MKSSFDPNAAGESIMRENGWPGGKGKVVRLFPPVTPAMIDAGVQAMARRGLPVDANDVAPFLRTIYEAMERAR